MSHRNQIFASSDTGTPPIHSDELATNQLTNAAHVGMLGDFCGGFENSLKSQANGAIQTANKLGANISETELAPVDNAGFGSKEWAAQIAGQAAALSLELFAARKLGAILQETGREGTISSTAGSIAPTARLIENGSSKFTSSVTLGAVLGGVLTPTNDSENFWSDRLRNTVSGAVSFGAMGGVSVGLAEASKLSSGALSTALRNGYVNNAVGGFVGGAVGEMTRAGLSGEMPTISKDYWQHVAQAGAEFGLMGIGAHSLDRVANGVSVLGEQRQGTDRTNAKYFTDSIGLTRNPQTFNNQVDFKVISGHTEVDRLTREVSAGAEKSQADVLVRQQLHGVLGDVFGPKFRPHGEPKLMLLSHGTTITPEAAVKYDLIGTCSPLDGILQSKDVFKNRVNSAESSSAVWLDNRTDSAFSLSRERVQGVQRSTNFEPVMLGSVGLGPVEVDGQPLRPGVSWNVNSQLEVIRNADGRLYARGRSQSDGVWERITSCVNVIVSPGDRLYRGQDPVSPDYLRSAQYLRAGTENPIRNGQTVGKNANGELYVRDNTSVGTFVRRAPGKWVELTTNDQYIHLGPGGKVDLKIASFPELSPKDSVRVNGMLLRSGAKLTVGRLGDPDVRIPNFDLTVSRVHGVVNRDASGQIYVTDLSSCGTYMSVPRHIRIPLEPTDTVGILSQTGQLELHRVNLAIKTNAERNLQSPGSNLKIEPVFVGRTASGSLYLQDSSAAGAAWLRLRKLEPTPVPVNSELIVGFMGTKLKLDFAPPVAQLLKPKVDHEPLRREYRRSIESGILFGYKNRPKFDSTDPAEIKKHLEQLNGEANKPIHSGQWEAVKSKGDVSGGARNYLLFDKIDDARGAASFIEGIIHRKTKGADEVGFSAKKIGDKFTPLISWGGVEGMVALDQSTSFPRAIIGRSQTRLIPQ